MIRAMTEGSPNRVWRHRCETFCLIAWHNAVRGPANAALIWMKSTMATQRKEIQMNATIKRNAKRCGLVIAAIAGMAMSVYAGHRVLCGNCRGKGWFQTRCVYCSGTGQVACSVCNGRGSVGAPGCIPVPCGCTYGKRICWSCTGTGIGEDLIKCRQCEGTGSYFLND